MRPRHTNRNESCQIETLEGRQMMTATVPNNTFDTASFVPDYYLNGSYVKADSLNAAAPNGFYKFATLYGKSQFHANLYGLSKDADLYLYNQDRQLVASSSKGSNQSEEINANLNAREFYYVRVARFGGDTGFTLSLQNDYSGNTLATARDVGASWGQGNEKFWAIGQSSSYDYLNYRDNVDIVKFRMEAPGTIALQRILSQKNSTLVASIQLLDASGNVIATPSTAGDGSSRLDGFNAAAGTYYLKFTQVSGSGDYQFRIVSDYAGTTVAKARDLGNLSNTTRQLYDMVGDVDDLTDLYKFTLDKRSPLDLQLLAQVTGRDVRAGLATDANGDGVIGANESFLTAGGVAGTLRLSTTLNAGTYYLVVAPIGGNLSYQLDFDSDFDNTAPDPSSAGNMTKATDAGNLKGESIFTGGFGISGGNFGDFTDFYKFRMTANGRLNASAFSNTYWSRATGDPSLVIIRDANNNGRYDNGENVTQVTNQKLAANLAAGNYFIRVNHPGHAEYRLRLVANYAGGTLGTARNLTPVTGKTPAKQTFSDYIEQDFGAGSNTDDFYRVSLTAKYQATFATTGAAGQDLSLSLIRDVNNNGVVDAGDVLVTSDQLNSATESLTRTLDAGNYFVRVHGLNGWTNYQLDATFVAK